MIVVKTYNLNELDAYKFVVIFARYKDKWVYCKHKNRCTYETAGGHVEENELCLESAKRELYEETGAIKYNIIPMFDYSVINGGNSSNGQVFIAYIDEFETLPDYEMEEIIFLDSMPKSMTYPKILPILYEGIQKCLNLYSNKDELWDIYNENRELVKRTQRRGDPMKDGDYHLTVHVWIRNKNKEFLITKRSPNKGYPNMWECTGGSAVVGDDSLTAAIREVKEETGIDISTSTRNCVFNLKGKNYFCDVWLFEKEVCIEEIVLQTNETCDAKFVREEDIKNLVKTDKFVPVKYIDDFFDKLHEMDGYK